MKTQYKVFDTEIYIDLKRGKLVKGELITQESDQVYVVKRHNKQIFLSKQDVDFLHKYGRIVQDKSTPKKNRVYEAN